MASFKDPDPDGLRAEFFQKMWFVVGASICEIAFMFFETGCIPQGVNDTILTLITKVQNSGITQFRPISYNVSYKILTKTMTNRLKETMSNSIGPFHISSQKDK